MIQSLDLRFFQNHKHSHLEFHPGVNVIVGPSDNGKTALVRGLNWLAFNRPQGFGFRSHFAKAGDVTAVEVVTSENRTVRRAKTDKLNAYYVDGEEFKALRSDVPDEVVQILNMSEVNLQPQFSPYFLLVDSPGEVAKKMNTLVGLDIIDELLGKANRYKSQTNAQAKLTKDRADDYRKQIEAFPDLDKAEKLLESAERIEIEIKELVEFETKVQSIVDTCYQLDEHVKSLENITDARPEVDKALTVYKELQEVSLLSKTLASTVSQAKAAADSISSDESWLEGIRKELAAALKESESLKSQKKYQAELTSTLSEVKSITRTLSKAAKRVELAHMSKVKFLQKNPTCPLCKQRVK